MSNSQLSINLSPKTSYEGDYFIYLKQILPEDEIVDAEDAANFIDTLYNTSICDQSYDLPACGGDIKVGTSIEDDEPTEEDVKEALTGLDFLSCNELINGYYTAQVKIYKSHPHEDYRLVITNGEQVGSTYNYSEEKEEKFVVRRATSISLDFRVDRVLQLEWSTPVYDLRGKIEPPELRIEGNNIVWDTSASGTVLLKALTTYDYLEIEVPYTKFEQESSVTGRKEINIVEKEGYLLSATTVVDKIYWQGVLTSEGEYTNPPEFDFQNAYVYWGKPVTGKLVIITKSLPDSIEYLESIVQAYYHYQLGDELTLQSPEVDLNLSPQQLQNICSQYEPDLDDGSVIRGDDNKTCYEIQRQEIRCNCDQKLIDTQEVRVPVTCPEGHSGGQVGVTKDSTVIRSCDILDQVHDPLYYEQKCCEPVPGWMSLPQCETHVTLVPGSKLPSASTRAHYAVLYGDNVRYIPVTPFAGYCGKKIVEQSVYQKNCCGDATSMVWVETHDNLEWNENYRFVVKDGVPPYQWSTQGKGLNVSSNGASAIVSVSDCFCKPGQIIVTDACDQQISHDVTSEDGFWLEIPVEELPGSFREVPGSFTYVQLGVFDVTAIQGDYKVVQRYTGASNSLGFYESGSGSACMPVTYPNPIPENGCSDIWIDAFQCHTPKVPATHTIYTIPEESRELALGSYCENISAGDWEYIFGGGWGFSVGLIYSFSTTTVHAYKWDCGQWDELLYDDENSAEVIADDSDGIVFWEGGKSPFWVTVEGDGFFLDASNQLKAFQYQARSAKIYTANSCGGCSITITDSCGDEVTGWVTSTVGVWEEIYNNPDGGWLDYDGVDPPPIYSGLLRGDHVGYTKDYKIEQTFYDLTLATRTYFVNRDYTTVLNYCESTKYSKQPDTQKITGGVFYREPGFCNECGKCQGSDYTATGDYRSIDLGFHARIWGGDPWWSMESYWQTVAKTKVYRWSC